MTVWVEVPAGAWAVIIGIISLKKKKKNIEINQLDGITSAELTGDFDGESRAHLVEVDGIGSAEEEE